MPRLLSSFCSCVIAALARLVIVLVAEPIFTPATFISVSHGSQALAKKNRGLLEESQSQYLRAALSAGDGSDRR